MACSIILQELENSRWIVSVVLLRGGELVVVEPDVIRKGPYSKDLEYGNMAQTRITGYVIAAQLYTDFLTGAEYLLILKDCGVLEVLDSNLDRLDMLDISRAGNGNEQPLMVLDDRNQKIYVNTKKNQIMAIQFKVSGERFNFIRSDKNPQSIFEPVESIINMEISWHVDFEFGRDFVAMSVLLFDEFSKRYYFEVIKQQQVDTRKKKQPWLSLIEKTPLEVDAYRTTASMNSKRLVTFKAVSNIGFFIFSLHCNFFFELPGGSMHTLAGKQIEKLVKCECLDESFNDNSCGDIELHSSVLLLQTVNDLKFTVVTTSNFAITVKIDLVQEDTEELVYHWDRFLSSKHVLCGLPTTATGCQVVQFMPLNSSQCILLTVTNGIIFIGTKNFRIYHTISFPLRTAFYSAGVGENFSKHVVCGGSQDNKGFLESRWIGLKDFLSLNQTFTSPNKIFKIWSTRDRVWWKTHDGRFYQDGKIVDVPSSVIHISMSDEVVSESAIIIATNIENDEEGNYCFITSGGMLCWSNEDLQIKIKNFKSSKLVRYNLACFKDAEGTKVTVIAIDNVLTLLRGHSVNTESLNVTSRLEAISMLCVVPSPQPKYVLLGDIGGRLLRLDMESMAIVSEIKVSCGRVRFCGIPKSGDVFVYTPDDLLVWDHSDFHITRVDFKHTICHISSRNEMIDIMIDDYTVISCSVHSDLLGTEMITSSITSSSHFHTKFVQLPCSTRYVVTNSLRSEYSVDYKRNILHTELQLHDIQSGKTVSRHDVSKLFPQAIISDIAAVPFEEGFELGLKASEKKSFAERQTLSKCFIVSLDYETAEDDNELNNLLLFSIDDGVIEFHLGLRTRSVVTTLKNYYQHLFLAAGDVLQIFKIDYSVKDNAFKIESVSNEITLLGFTKSLLLLENFSLNHDEKKMPKRNDYIFPSHRVVGLNIFKGFQEYELFCNDEHCNQNLEIPYIIRIRPIPNSRRIIESIETFNDQMMTSASLINGTGIYLAVAWTNNVVTICRTSYNGLKESVEFKMPCQVTNITSFGQNTFNSDVASEEGKNISDIFMVTTCQGGSYILHFESNLSIKSEQHQMLEEQNRFIAVAEDGIGFIDTRILDVKKSSHDLAMDAFYQPFSHRHYC
ncbi:hypothetical protein HG535_0B03640 [Zygotorulaspora mrakii]|uniref:Cleavage/polyadenylation specificity factor A subunit N-terminal domain-containing protein n=1 Tax=Zygotorulaspora mrakii TaxID=42260 RepID=A0A7H9AY51_ZYGMR|nr:uncharacterized protein HG535_0B03640 [Zygotorulaspora mrakii]QLG71325.1 hypothetical protein HG535_0B03640 [Zygotorulaspora mrakii]